MIFKRKHLYGSPRIATFSDFIRISRKNHRLNKNIREFIKNYSDNIKPREKEFHPEVVVTCYKQGKYIETALSSIKAASNDIDITVIDDASPDKSQDQIKHLTKDYAFKFIANKVNLGGVATINRAVSSSNNNLFIILNADDALIKYSVNTVIELMNSTKVRLIGGNAISFKEESLYRLNNNLPPKLDYLPKGRMYGPEDALDFKHLNDINLTTSSSAFLRSAWESVDGFWGFKKRVCHAVDRDFQMRVCALFNILIIEEPLAFYRINKTPFPTSVKG